MLIRVTRVPAGTNPISILFFRLLRNGLNFRRLPKLDPVAFGIHRPAKVTKLRFLGPLVYGHSVASKLREQCIEIGYPKINHERLLARRKVIAVGGKGRPDRVSLALRPGRSLTLAKSNAAVFFHLQTEMFAIPCAKFFRILRLKENPTDASDVFHTSGRWLRPLDMANLRQTNTGHITLPGHPTERDGYG